MAAERGDVMSDEYLSAEADNMTIPADIKSVSGSLKSMVDCFRALPHIRRLDEPRQAISDLRDWLRDQRGNPSTAQDESGLQSLQNVLRDNLRSADEWNRLRLLIEPSAFAEKLRETFCNLKGSLSQLQVPPRDDIVERLDKVITNLDAGGDFTIMLNKAETKFKAELFTFLQKLLSKSAIVEDVISVRDWLAKQLGKDVDSRELEEIKQHADSLVEGLIVYVAELEESKHRTVQLVSEPSGEQGAELSSDAALDAEAFALPLDMVARNGVQALGAEGMARVLQGFANLIRCTKFPGGKLEVYKAGAITEAIRLAKAGDGQYVRQAMKLLEALTSPRGGVPLSSERDEIFIEVSDYVEVLIKLIKAKRHPEARLLAAKTVVNILVNQSVWQTVRSSCDIVSALVSILNEDPVDRSIDELNRADRVCLLGLSRLTELSNGVNLKISSPGDRTQIVISVLMQLLREGLKDDSEANLAKDSLVALDTQVRDITPTPEVGSLVRKHTAELMETEAFLTHSTVPGRVAIISIMTKLCASYKEDITEGLFLYVLRVIESAGDEMVKLSDSGEEKREGLAKLLSLSVRLLCFCVSHGKDMAQSVLSKNTEARATLEKLLNEPNLGISHESRLEIMDVLDQIFELDSQPPTAVEMLTKLVKMLDSSPEACQPQVATRILKCVMESQGEIDAFEIEKTGVMVALMGLLKEENEDCRKDALLALDILSPYIAIQAGELPCQTILNFLGSTRREVREAAVGLLDLMVAKKAVVAKMFMETLGALKYILVTLRDSTNLLPEGHEGPETKSSRNCGSALLKLATEVGDDSVRLGILNGGLDTVLKYVQKSRNDEFKEMLTTMLSLICETGNGPNLEAVTEGGGHIFLLTSLREKISKEAEAAAREKILKEAAARGLLSLIRANAKCRADVLKAGFVTIAVDSVEQRFASTDIALALAEIFSTSEMDQTYAGMKGVQALLVLLEHCPDLAGKGAAAAVIAKLYPRLNRTDDAQRQVEMTAACPHLLRYLELEDKSQLRIFLRALAAFATGKRGRQRIHEERGEALIQYLKNKQFDNEAQGLILKILAEMSCVFTEGSEIRGSTYLKILNMFLGQKISELLSKFPKSEEFNRNTENMKNLLTLIRNFSIAGPAAVTQLSEHGAVDVLLEILKRHKAENHVSVVTELAVKALEKFMDEPSGKQTFLKGNGIQSLVAVLKLTTPRGCDVKSFTTIILTSVAKDPDTRRQACEIIYSCDEDLLSYLNNIMYEGETSRAKWQAAVLMKLLAMYGPTTRVCAAIQKSGSLEALKHLREVQHCKEMANDVLRFVRDKSRECRREIDSWPK